MNAGNHDAGNGRAAPQPLREDARLASPAVVAAGLERCDYIATHETATALFVAAALEKPLLLEGPAGVGKTELAKTMARYLEWPLIRLQCYEGLDESRALYEWQYGKQLLYVQILRDKLAETMAGIPTLREAVARLHAEDELFFSEAFLEPRPLLQALQSSHGAILLIDEVDKADAEFEALLLEILADFQVTIPELGTMVAAVRPLVFLTSNRAREMGDALRRRCLHLCLDFPDAALEARIVAARVPGLGTALREQVVAFVQRVRRLDLRKLPAVSETIDWARALVLLHADQLDDDLINATLSALVKFEEDGLALRSQGQRLLRETLEAASSTTPPIEASQHGSHPARLR